MADILCGYTADRDETLVAYLYGDIDEAQRSAFEAHIATCDRCGRELKEMQDVRWVLQQATEIPASDPLPAAMFPLKRLAPVARRGWRDIPVWAQAAAAMLVFGASAGIANLDVHYDRSGLTVRTGWSRTAAPSAVVTGPDASRAATGQAADAPWRADIEALERRLRVDAHNTASQSSVQAEASGADAQLLRKVRALVGESELRQKNELALAIGDLAKQFDNQRGNDLANIRFLKSQQEAAGIEIIRQRGAIDYLRQVSLQR